MSRNKYPEETRALIVDVATKLFFEKGYEHTTIQEIIDGLGGLTKGAVYHHFKSKEEILSAVIEKIFGGEDDSYSLQKKWRKIVADKKMSGSEKVSALLLAGIEDNQEMQFRMLGVDLKKFPHLATDLMVRSVNEIAPSTYLPVIEQGISDGSIKTTHPKELAEIIVLLSNIWISPLIFSMTPNEMKGRFELAKELLLNYSIDISSIYEPLLKMINDMSNKN